MPRKKTTRKQPPPPISDTFQAPVNPDDEFERLAAETLNEFDTQGTVNTVGGNCIDCFQYSGYLH